MYRSSLCGHCRDVPSGEVCEVCGLFVCPGCQARGCGQDADAWTGSCGACGRAFPDDQRRDVLEDGEGEVACRSCGWTYRLRRLDRVGDPRVAAALRAVAAECGGCGDRPEQRALGAHFVLHDLVPTQVLYHLLCRCGRPLASEAGPRS